MRIQELLYTPAKDNTTQRYWYVLDGRGNVVALTDSTGKVVDRYHYDLWGAPVTDREDVPQPFRFAGYLLDRELALPGEVTQAGQQQGWYWLSVRHYDPQLKRFLQSPTPAGRRGPAATCMRATTRSTTRIPPGRVSRRRRLRAAPAT